MRPGLLHHGVREPRCRDGDLGVFQGAEVTPASGEEVLEKGLACFGLGGRSVVDDGAFGVALVHSHPGDLVWSLSRPEGPHSQPWVSFEEALRGDYGVVGDLI